VHIYLEWKWLEGRIFYFLKLVLVFRKFEPLPNVTYQIKKGDEKLFKEKK